MFPLIIKFLPVFDTLIPKSAAFVIVLFIIELFSPSILIPLSVEFEITFPIIKEL